MRAIRYHDEARLELARITANQGLVAAMKSPDVIERYAGLGGEPRTSTPDELAQYIKSEMAKWTRVAQVQKIRVDLTR